MEVKAKYIEDELLTSGKTKDILSVKGYPGLAILRNKDNITKNDDPDQTRIMHSKAMFATTTTCAILGLLKQAGLPVAFVEQISETEFVADKCAMILLEVVGRRYAVGSFLKRMPDFATPEGSIPYRFPKWRFELFLKTTGKEMLNKNGEHIGNTPVDDPYIYDDPYDSTWSLHHPKIVAQTNGSDLGLSLEKSSILPEGITVKQIEEIFRKAVLIIEGAFAKFGYRFIDVKIEFGVNEDGELMIADVIDNDSWRLRDSNWGELSKQLFRDGENLTDIQEKYAIVADLVKHFNIPKQAIIICGDYTFADLPNIPGIDVINVVGSRHLDDVLTQYVHGSVVLYHYTNAPRDILDQITIPITESANEYCGDRIVTGSWDAAVQMAARILAINNPAAYMMFQYHREKETLD